jgi:hypothetical protein
MQNHQFNPHRFAGGALVAASGLAFTMAAAVQNSATEIAEIVSAHRAAQDIECLLEDLIEAHAGAQRTIVEQQFMIECLQAELAAAHATSRSA